jgi:hypothetical protein
MVGERLRETDSAQPFASLGQAFGESDGRPPAYSREHREVLLTLVRVRDRIADDARGRFE